MCAQILWFSTVRVRARVRVHIRVSLVKLVCASTLDNNVVLSIIAALCCSQSMNWPHLAELGGHRCPKTKHLLSSPTHSCCKLTVNQDITSHAHG